MTPRTQVEQAVRDMIRHTNRGGRYTTSTHGLLKLGLRSSDVAAALEAMADEGLMERAADIYCSCGEYICSGPRDRMQAVLLTKKCRECVRPRPTENSLQSFWETTPALLAQLAPAPGVLTVGEVADLLAKLPRADDVRTAAGFWALLGVAPPPAESA